MKLPSRKPSKARDPSKLGLAAHGTGKPAVELPALSGENSADPEVLLLQATGPDTAVLFQYGEEETPVETF